MTSNRFMYCALGFVLLLEAFIPLGKWAEGCRLGPYPILLGALSEWLLVGQFALLFIGVILGLPCLLIVLLIGTFAGGKKPYRNVVRLLIVLVLWATSFVIVWQWDWSSAAFGRGRQLFESR